MLGVHPRTLSSELADAFGRQRKVLADRVETLAQQRKQVFFDGELVSLEVARERYGQLRRAQTRVLVEVVGLYVALGAGAWLMFRLIKAFCR